MKDTVRGALVEKNIIINVAIFQTPADVFEGWYLVGREVGIGWIMISDGVFQPPKAPEMPPETRRDMLKRVVEMHIDDTARKFGYKNMDSIAKYLAGDNEFEKECNILSLWNAECWATCFTLLYDLNVTPDNIIEKLPKISFKPPTGIK